MKIINLQTPQMSGRDCLENDYTAINNFNERYNVPSMTNSVFRYHINLKDSFEFGVGNVYFSSINSKLYSVFNKKSKFATGINIIGVCNEGLYTLGARERDDKNGNLEGFNYTGINGILPKDNIIAFNVDTKNYTKTHLIRKNYDYSVTNIAVTLKNGNQYNIDLPQNANITVLSDFEETLPNLNANNESDSDDDNNNSTFDALTMTSPIQHNYNYKQSTLPKVTFSGNFIDLKDDYTYCGNKKNVGILQTNFNCPSDTSNTNIVSLKARYIPSFPSDIFKGCIHLPKLFIVDCIQNGSLLVMQTLRYNSDIFLTGNALSLSPSDLNKTAVYKTLLGKQYGFLVFTKYGYLSFSEPKFHLFNADNSLCNYNQLIKDMAQFYNPITLAPTSYKHFINTEMNNIRQDYISSGKDDSSSNPNHLFSKSSFSRTIHNWNFMWGTRRISYWFPILITLIIVYCLIHMSSGLDINFQSFYPIIFASAVLFIYLCACAWNTLLVSQVMTNKKAVRFTGICSVVFICLFMMTAIGTHKKEVNISNSDLTELCGSGNSQTSSDDSPYDMNTLNDDDDHISSHDVIPNSIKITNNEIKSTDKNHPMIFKITNYYYDYRRNGLVLKGHYANSSRFVKFIEDANYENQDSHAHDGGDADKIYALKDNGKMRLNFTGNNTDWSTKYEDHTATIDTDSVDYSFAH